MRLSKAVLLVALALGSFLGVGVGWAQPLPPGEPPFTRWAPEPGITESVIGYSALGRPLIVHHLGQGEPVLLLGAQHGGPERNTSVLVWQLFDYFDKNPEAIPLNLRLDIMPEANPDGLALGSRQFASGKVDPNRNWGGPDWQEDGWDSNAVFRSGLGGPKPFSEPETQALRDYVLQTRPLLTINYHSRGGFLFRGGTDQSSKLAETYANLSHYALPGGGSGGAPGGGGSPLGYRATGSMNVWMRSAGLGGFLIELATATDPEFGRNLPALKATLNELSDGTS